LSGGNHTAPIQQSSAHPLLEILLDMTRFRLLFTASSKLSNRLALVRRFAAGSVALVCALSYPSPARGDTTGDSVPAAPALPARLALDEALRIFRSTGLDLLVAEAQVRSAEGDARIARAINNPDLSVGVGRALTNCDGCSAPALSATLSDSGAISDALFGKHALRVDVADAALQAAKLDKRDAQRILESSLKQQFLAVVVSKANLELGRQAHSMAVQAVTLVQHRVSAGAAAESDLLKVETDTLQLEDQADANELVLKTAKVNLAFLLGVRGMAPDFDVDDALLAQAEHARLDNLDRDSVLSEALRRRSDVLSAEYGERQARAAEALARRTRIPQISLWANYAMQGNGPNAPTPPTLTVGIDTPLPIFYQNQGEVMKAESDLFARRLRRAKVSSQVVSDVASALVSFDISRRRLERMGASLLERARRSRDLTALQYERGAASLLELLDSERTFLSVNASYLQSISDYWNAIFAVEQASGRTLH
jgi:cobalt-zinc-cadmium efflux system outer membrane protein